jgi:hypothetical protein
MESSEVEIAPEEIGELNDSSLKVNIIRREVTPLFLSTWNSVIAII